MAADWKPSGRMQAILLKLYAGGRVISRGTPSTIESYPPPKVLGAIEPVRWDTLRALCNRHLVVSTGRAPRVHYKLTAAGRRLAEQLVELRAFDAALAATGEAAEIIPFAQSGKP